MRNETGLMDEGTGLEVWNAEVDDHGLAHPMSFVRKTTGKYWAELVGPNHGEIDDWTPSDEGRLVLVKFSGETVASFLV